MPAMPALFTRMSMRPNAVTVSSRARSTSLMSVTSTAIATTLPRLLNSLAVFSAKALSRSQIATLAPESRNRSTIALPIPCAPPVITAKRPVRSILLGMGVPPSVAVQKSASFLPQSPIMRTSEPKPH